jgi:hypothetical protein
MLNHNFIACSSKGNERSPQREMRIHPSPAISANGSISATACHAILCLFLKPLDGRANHVHDQCEAADRGSPTPCGVADLETDFPIVRALTDHFETIMALVMPN